MNDGSVPSFPKVLCVVVCLMLISGTLPDAVCPQEGYAPLSPADLESLVAPIALYPGELVAQGLVAAIPSKSRKHTTGYSATAGCKGKH